MKQRAKTLHYSNKYGTNPTRAAEGWCSKNMTCTFNRVRGVVFALYFLAFLVPPVSSALAADSAVAIMYHRFGDSRHPATNTTIAQFEAHIEELSSDKYTVMPLPDIVASLRSGRDLPENTVGISIDDAFLSVYREAWPRLRRANFPFTLFVATNPIDNRLSDYMSWDQIRELAQAGVTIGSQTASHPHMAFNSQARNARELEKSNERFRAELGKKPSLIAYPYGEYSLAVGKVAREAGFGAAFGQHSGVMHGAGDFYFLPRFALNEAYGDINRLRMAAQALPLRARDITPADTLIGAEGNPPLFGFTVEGLTPSRLSRLACYVSGQNKARLERLGDRRIEVRMAQAFRPGRTRINCTLPEKGGRWRWFGRQFVTPRQR
jgi:peptidoglycan/xylan/chitin deacetylase (PgdA/CDA1 family)